jgi:hypothetical protein
VAGGTQIVRELVFRVKDVLRISSEMALRSPVFIIGEARSGTSILYRTLQKHPAFRPREIDLTETHIFDLIRRTFMFRPDYPEPLRRYMLYDASAYREFLRSIRIVRAVSLANVLPNLLIRDPGRTMWHLNLGRLLLRSYFFHAARARACNRIVEKTPTNSRHIQSLTDAFPRARLLYVHRHPVDVFSSYRRRAKDDPDASWADISIDEFIRSYGASVYRVLRWIQAGHKNLLLVRYESFTQDPGSAFERICRFLGERFDTSAVHEDQPQHGRWRGDPHLWGAIVPATKDWHSYATSDEAKRIQLGLCDLMKSLGYRPYID